MTCSKPKILVVDDTPASLKLLSELLRAEDYEVRSAIDGELALESAFDNPPDLVLLDIMMPGIDGFEVCRRLKAHPATRQVPVIFVSTLSDTEEKVQGFQLGAVDYVSKPYQREELLARVRTHLEIERLRNRLEDAVAVRSSQLRLSEQKLRTTLNDYISAHTQLQTLLDTIPDLVWLKDPNGVYLACNLQLERLYGASEAEIVGKTDRDFVSAELADFFRQNDLKAVQAGKVCANEEWLEFADNGYRGVFETLKTPVRDANGNLIGVLGIARDISERRAAQAKIQRHMQLYAALSRCNKAIVQSSGEADLFLRVCQAAVEFGGMKMAWVGLLTADGDALRPCASFGEGAEELPSIDMALTAASDFSRSPTSVALREQRPYWCQDFQNDPLTLPWRPQALRAGWQAAAALPLHQAGAVAGVFVLYAGEVNAFDSDARDLLLEMATDIDIALDNFSRSRAQKQAEAEIERLAFYDPLTGLPNRRLLYDRLHQAVVTNARAASHGAALFIDLDNFKALNDTKGHNQGDLLLVEVARRLEACVREGDTVARLGGDEFVVILNGLNGDAAQASAQTKMVGGKILAAIGRPYLLHGYEHHCSASMGIGLFRDPDTTVEELLKCIDTALYQAKRNGRNGMQFYDPAMQQALEAKAALESDLRRALEENGFVLYYQPQVDQDGRTIGAEVLIRWLHPQRGLVPPAEFIPLAEETGLIVPIGNWVVETACAQLKLWEGRAGLDDLQLAVNVSAPQFRQADFVAQVRRTLERYGLNPGRLKLELTESLVLDDIDDTIVKMQQLRESGVRFSMDDFGTGYSSLYYLTKLPFDQLKIDRSFVHNLGVTQNDAVIIQTIIGMAENLGIESLAEGVESEEQLGFLNAHGCNLYQGFLFGRPLPLEQFQARLQAFAQKRPDDGIHAATAQ
ncbi:EAL domain-containing protein [Methylomonas koyamae]|uniref:EAL domain-containing protein n=1 Tax=Methylomonas koyamae TaxID=702114 RepID=UPI0028733059|nr:EAL domain-containing protein [Methylomonas koyamae]WNB76640.1 EAL domain-containing protein [Methylomonas koyamae]